MAEARLASLDITLFRGLTPVGGFYIPARRTGNLVYISGQVPRIQVDGRLELVQGKVGADCDAEFAEKAARLCGVSILSVLRDLIGSLDRVTAVVKVDGFVNATPSFQDHPSVINGCSDLFVDVFGKAIGSHARAAVGCSSLPKGVPVEVAAIFEIRD